MHCFIYWLLWKMILAASLLSQIKGMVSSIMDPWNAIFGALLGLMLVSAAYKLYNLDTKLMKMFRCEHQNILLVGTLNNALQKYGFFFKFVHLSQDLEKLVL